MLSSSCLFSYSTHATSLSVCLPCHELTGTKHPLTAPRARLQCSSWPHATQPVRRRRRPRHRPRRGAPASSPSLRAARRAGWKQHGGLRKSAWARLEAAGRHAGAAGRARAEPEASRQAWGRRAQRRGSGRSGGLHLAIRKACAGCTAESTELGSTRSTAPRQLLRPRPHPPQHAQPGGERARLERSSRSGRSGRPARACRAPLSSPTAPLRGLHLPPGHHGPPPSGRWGGRCARLAPYRPALLPAVPHSRPPALRSAAAPQRNKLSRTAPARSACQCVNSDCSRHGLLAALTRRR